MNKKTSICLTVALAFFISACNTEKEPNTSRPDFIIDSHIHYRGTDDWEKSFVEVFTAHKAMGCVLIGMNYLERGIQFAKDHPELVIPYAAIDIDSPTVTDDIRMVKEMGYKGLGELFATKGWNYDNPKYDSIWILAEQFQMPIAPHTGIHARGNFAGMRPAFVASIAERHRNLIIHAAHFGNPWYPEAAEGARLIVADFLKFKQGPIKNRLMISIPLFAVGYGLTLIDFAVIWRYFAWSNQTLAMIVLWAITVYLAREKKFYWITLIPALFMTTVITSYLLFAPEGFGLPYLFSVYAGLSFAVGAAILFFAKLNTDIAISLPANVPDKV